MKSSASYSKLFQSRSKGEIPGRTWRKECLSRSKLKRAFLIDSDAELFMYLIQCTVKPLLSRPQIKRTPSIKRTLEASGAPNDGFLLNTLKTRFRLSRVFTALETAF